MDPTNHGSTQLYSSHKPCRIIQSILQSEPTALADAFDNASMLKQDLQHSWQSHTNAYAHIL